MANTITHPIDKVLKFIEGLLAEKQTKRKPVQCRCWGVKKRNFKIHSVIKETAISFFKKASYVGTSKDVELLVQWRSQLRLVELIPWTHLSDSRH